MKSLCLSAAAALMLCTALSAQAERTLKVSLQVNTKHPVGANVVFFKDQVEKISGGEIKVEIYDSAQLYKGSEIPQAVAAGAIDMGLVLVDEYAGTLPATGLFSVAFLFPNYDVLAKAAAPESPVRQEIDEMIRATGTRVLWWQDYGPVQLLSKEHAVSSPADMKGKKVRVLGKPSGDFIEAVGGIPVKIGGSEQFIAYQRGTVDIGMTGTTAIQSRKLFEVMNYVTITNHAQTEFLIVMNDKLWDSLSDQEKDWVSKAALSAEQKIRADTKKNNLDSEKFIADKTSMKVVHLDDAQVKAWQAAAAPAVDAYIKEAGDVGKRLVDEVKKFY
ncbi:C4-dicarboxylate ABC transporter substrate-binding protein [Allopusillimonas soli]|uniref:TRAP transporter substrate-binding protein DctP n=2 Tax=Allopusillimonas soli TaxID=659016 RepID=A0A853F747_9BURK|nr:TRAP transporter substrate-binding protein DctP [Allopusillimonas soli]NYT35362.1 TRAP transporter substrate-binding protein DctP [Allopusillimonas soli]TEA76708.1 C4-dicarboxylate ABC transporter substrate-binding protein [Allopusillimonas soli]